MIVAANSITFANASPPSEHLSDDERDQIRANRAREQASRNTESRLGYPHVYEDEVAGIQQDFISLSHQIAQLNLLLQAMAAGLSSGPGFMPSPPYGPPGSVAGPVPHDRGQTNMTRIYGPEGPTKRTVRVILEYRLMVMGNPRLKVGNIKEHKDKIKVQVVTVDGSVVEEYSVDKKTGYWHLTR